ncbi:hypothetical protein AAT19DRAFT_10159 [Rhodotorula toruloides]|uniref:Uncharacterized protein n=1 Tax=Rhodotorula toruloides TaxID=5286 RepID=A0A2S9ZZY4_RHOTO|nr:hypothetical protein AAT19DRAFT_10159 [Rhodotorula toruloides]
MRFSLASIRCNKTVSNLRKPLYAVREGEMARRCLLFCCGRRLSHLFPPLTSSSSSALVCCCCTRSVHSALATAHPSQSHPRLSIPSSHPSRSAFVRKSRQLASRRR